MEQLLVTSLAACHTAVCHNAFAKTSTAGPQQYGVEITPDPAIRSRLSVKCLSGQRAVLLQRLCFKACFVSSIMSRHPPPIPPTVRNFMQARLNATIHQTIHAS
jgi:organic hydroperoxide reductase OsmC/OhrA